MKAKAVCVMRTDLRNSDGHKVPKGKLIAQGGHAFVGMLTKLMGTVLTFDPDEYYDEKTLYCRHGGALYEWLRGSFTKVVLGVDSEEELLSIYAAVKKAGFNAVLITDNGLTEFHEPTNTCIGIGPDWEDKIDAITGHLKGFQ
jgi:peptidyl-tRNA hydrolase